MASDCRRSRLNTNQEDLTMKTAFDRRSFIAVIASLATNPATTSTAVADTDPIFAAIARCETANAKCKAGAMGTAAIDELKAAQCFAATIPTTVAGLLAMIQYAAVMAAPDRDLGPDNDDSLCPMAALTAAARQLSV
jgi:hypothetical protein